MSMKPIHPLKSQLSIDWKVKNKKNSIKTTKFKFGFEKLKNKIHGKKTQTNYVWLSYWEKRKLLDFFSIRFTMTQKNYSTFSNKIKKQKDPPYNLLNWKTLPIKFPQI